VLGSEEKKNSLFVLPSLQVLLGCVFVFRIINVFSIHQCNPEPQLAAPVAAEEVFLFAVTVMCFYFSSFLWLEPVKY